MKCIKILTFLIVLCLNQSIYGNFQNPPNKEDDKIAYYKLNIYRKYQDKQYTKALFYCNEILKINKKDSVALNYRGLVNMKLENYQLAKKDFDLAIKCSMN